MIDVENEVFTRINTRLVEKFNPIFITSEKVAQPNSYPCVSIEEIDNFPISNTIDSASNENHVEVLYEIRVFSNKSSGKKTQCKDIFEICDNEFLAMGFVRTMKQPVNMDDAATYQLLGRYRAAISKNKTVYRR